MRKINILLFDEVELLDFAGPLEVFSVADYLQPDLDLQVLTIGFEANITVTKSKIRVIPNQVNYAGEMDLLIIPGGIGTRQIITSQEPLNRIDSLIKNSKVTASVCTGALILGKLGYLRDQRAITHRKGIEELKQIDNTITIDQSQRFVDNHKFLTAAGISAGIDMSLYLVQKYFGLKLRERVQTYMEYND